MSFQQGLSGLNSSSSGLDAVGNNVANSSTVGYKGSNAHFASVYAASLSGGAGSQIGIGSTVASIFQQFTQGNITTTANSLDLAINGGGFFKVSRDNAISYTRNGQFHTNKDGYIVNDQGYELLGYPAAANGTIVVADPAPIRIDTSNIAPRATGATEGGPAKIVMNLNSQDGLKPVADFSPADPTSYNYSTSMTVYDTMGAKHTVALYFLKTAASAAGSQWNVQATLDGDTYDGTTVPSSTDSDPSSLTSLGTLYFSNSGQLDITPPHVSTLALPSTAAWAVTTGAASPLGTGTGITDWNINFSGSTSFAGSSTVTTMRQGGYAQGTLTSLSVGADGVIQGNYSNGQTRDLAQVVLTTFANANGLLNLGNNLWQATAESGEAMDGAPGDGSRGVLQSKAIEESNVDLTSELVNMITLQRNYQANAQTIKTQDQIMQTLVSMR